MLVLNCSAKKEGGKKSDRQKWKEEVERYSRKKYQDDGMNAKARKELQEWEESSRRQRSETGESQEPKLTMSVIMQSRASFSIGKAVGVDGISAKILKSIPWRALQKIKKAFERRYTGENKEEIETWLRVPSKTIRKPKVLFPVFVESWSKKMRTPNSSALNPLTHDLSGLGFVELQNRHVFTTCW